MCLGYFWGGGLFLGTRYPQRYAPSCKVCGASQIVSTIRQNCFEFHVNWHKCVLEGNLKQVDYGEEIGALGKFMKLQTTPPKGMRDHGTASSIERKYIQDTITHIFVKYGFLPLETSAMEHRSTLVGQYGGECEKLIFQVLNSGDYLQPLREHAPAALAQADVKTLTPEIVDKALRYDLTVPLARYVSAHWQHLPTPFKRYQIQPVWRADRPQKGTLSGVHAMRCGRYWQ